MSSKFNYLCASALRPKPYRSMFTIPIFMLPAARRLLLLVARARPLASMLQAIKRHRQGSSHSSWTIQRRARDSRGRRSPALAHVAVPPVARRHVEQDVLSPRLPDLLQPGPAACCAPPPPRHHRQQVAIVLPATVISSHCRAWRSGVR
eukprot:16428305-Heterocapsa_arctica.AAC.1